MKALDYDKVDALLGLEYNGEEIDTFEALEKQTIQAITLEDLQFMRYEIEHSPNCFTFRDCLNIINKYIAKAKE